MAPLSNDANAEAVEGYGCPPGLQELVEHHTQEIARGERQITSRFRAIERDVQREHHLGVQTRVLMGEREMRFQDFLIRTRELSQAFCDGLDELIRQW